MLNQRQIEAFKQEGFVVVEQLFSEADFWPLKEEFNAVVQQRARQLYEAGKISDPYESEPFERRLTKIAAERPEIAEALQTRAHKGEALFQFMKHPYILDRVEALLGGEILSHPSYNIHPRLPGGQTTPHQDAGYYLPDGDATLIVACLIPMVDTSLENGCLWVAPRRHKEGVFHHNVGAKGLEIPSAEVTEKEKIPMPMKAGDMVMFSSMLPHGSLINHTDTVRWSMDLRYQALGAPTGRWYVPGFVARSRAHPDLECPDWKAWVADVERVAEEAEGLPERPRSRWN
jgi:phytanoyl-CoA hydroxylase